MSFVRIVIGLALAALVVGCQAPYKKKDQTEKKEKSGEVIKDQSGDMSFRAFMGTLKIAVAKRDRAMLLSMMTSDFGWRWDAPPAGETPFDYWEHNHLWTELETLLQQRFVPHETFMVAPAEFAANPEHFQGYRAGMRLVGGSWRFNYFITGEDILP